MERIIHTLANGLRIVAEQSDGNVAYIGILTNAGSRDDAPGLDGQAHFVEHTIFKGTPRRRSWQVANRMELIGGELNAYTTKEEIMVYTNAPAGNELRSIELLSDLVANAWFPEVEIERERDVICEEIHSYRDNASFAVFDEFDELFYKNSQLAHNILGYENTVERISSKNAREFLKKNFVPSNMVLYCVSPTDPMKCIKLIDKYFGSFDLSFSPCGRECPAVNPAFSEIRERGNHQANALMGYRIFPANDPRRYALYLFSNILGGPSMNSRLNRELRERRGLVYTVETSISFYSDTGTFQIYFGSEPAKTNRCTELIRREIESLASTRLSERSFRQARQQLCGQLLVSGDNRESCAMGLAKSLLRHGEVHDNCYSAGMIGSLSAEDVRDIASYVAEKPMSRLVII